MENICHKQALKNITHPINALAANSPHSRLWRIQPQKMAAEILKPLWPLSFVFCYQGGLALMKLQPGGEMHIL